MDDKQPRVLQKLKRRANVKCGGSHQLFDPKFVHRQSSAVA